MKNFMLLKGGYNMNVEIIAIGTELLLGDIVNTNGQFLAKELATLGMNVYRQRTVGDNEERILGAFKDAFNDCDLIITTGGLGPTKDDMTKEMACKFFNKDLVLHKESFDYIKDYFEKLGRPLSENNKKQALFPEDAVILPNPNGTAPGAIIKGSQGKAIIILPGPPKEMKPMFNDYVKPYLEKISDGILYSKVLRLFGIGESRMAEVLDDIIEGQTNPTVAPYAKEMDVTLRITAKANSEEEASKLIYPMEKEIRSRLNEYIYGEGDTTLEDEVAKLLILKNKTISLAESCTGGMVSSMLVNYPGISEVFLEGAVTYTNEAKVRTLKVKKETLDMYTAVSEEMAIEMAEGIAKRTGSNIGVSITGIAGPGGGSEKQPVGLVYVGIYNDGKVRAEKFNFQGNRNKVRSRAAMNALDLIRKELI